MINQNPEQIARDEIDALLRKAGWHVQKKDKINFSVGLGVAVVEYQTDVGPADYVLFVDKQAIGIIEAKPEAWGEKITTVEEQSAGYANAKLKWVNNSQPLRFVYESTGVITRFTDNLDPNPRSREVFNFHCPETLAKWMRENKSLRGRLQDFPPLNTDGLRDCQITAITNLEASLKQDKPRALVQMATGSGKTFTAITASYRLLKEPVSANRILFLVDTKNLGEQAEQEFMSFVPNDDNRKFTELYTVQRLKNQYIAKDAQVCISTIQRMYSILKDEPLDEALEEENPAEQLIRPKEALPVVYNRKIPPEFFDVIIIDECHRSIYNLWRQVLEYFDAYLIGLTATPDNRTYGFFRKNVVSEYDHEKAVADGVNVGNEIYIIETEKTKQGGTISAKQQVEKRERTTRRKRWETQDEDEVYTSTQLDRNIVNPDQIRTVIRTFKEALPSIFPGRQEVPKTLIFAKTDSHADDIIQIVREEFGEGNQFCKKVTYRVAYDITDSDGNIIEKGEDPKSVLAQFRNDFYPRIAVTVDMIATGTDVKPLECLLFMRDVKSRNYFEQMKGRGTRTLEKDSLQKVTPSAQSAKTHYVIVDAIGVTQSLKTASQPLITKPSVSLKNLAMGVMMGASDSDTVSSLAGRLARLDKQLDDKERALIAKKAGGTPLLTIVGELFNAIDGDRVEQKALEITRQPIGTDPGDAARDQAQKELVRQVANVFNGELIELIDTIRRDKEQTIVHDDLDTVIKAEWAGETTENARVLTQEFTTYLQDQADKIDALNIYFHTPARRSEITYPQIKALLEQLKQERPKLAPLRIWHAYAHLDKYQGDNPISELTALVALIRRVSGIDKSITPFNKTVRKNFQDWIMKYHSGNSDKFNEQQMAWLHLIRDHIASSCHFERDDLDMSPFDAQGGLGRMHLLFGDRMGWVMEELNRELVA
ncbi:type I restriction-modification enzyme R subunit C-terminal domain-containing protein [Legionella pneumophila serogroup 1]|uniref:type I restriction endonuclease subunit R n=1 Tax=Legionella pneumophila TaxID=446 RepID=UPI0007708658|nr:DEAD/DEAH box helicase family protein [Legionella pneumophila]HAT8874847.1 DEAD/DEAH box helicase [Legionella pneumophila subsp. pneumophila]CZG51402.1 Type-1 restriction enzyme R protein [Legionella pneumophila]CZG65570.1 Type-1 restriction enzyme R protein [Legionella pneumophila]HAT1965170.1 DEAD/DEAH box helicase family protein [Legionella pneumophila]HAT8948511.1 DEAD/DEAH box helicase [Legionella pneumophila subsp. pneumophila]